MKYVKCTERLFKFPNSTHHNHIVNLAQHYTFYRVDRETTDGVTLYGIQFDRDGGSLTWYFSAKEARDFDFDRISWEATRGS